jgi:putative nucleotidyltransferase-like protein
MTPPANPDPPNSIQNEWSALLECCSPACDQSHLEKLFAAVSWPVLLNLATEHAVVAQLANRATEASASIPSDVAQKIRELHRAQIFSTLQMAAELFRLVDLFRSANLSCVLVKGPVLALRAYGDTGARQYGDLDFLVRHRDIGGASELMISAGYRANISTEAIRAEKIPGQYTFLRTSTPLLVELHTERTMRYFPRGLPIEDFFTRHQEVELDGHPIPALSPEDELVLVCIHGAKHLWDRLTLITDVAAYAARQSTLRWQESFATARAIGAERMLNAGLLLAQTLLRAPLPSDVAQRVAADRSAAELVKQISVWLPSAGQQLPGVTSRALYRMRMRGSAFEGLSYLFRLTFSPTQEDWGSSESDNPSDQFASLRRPFRLAKKYRR